MNLNFIYEPTHVKMPYASAKPVPQLTCQRHCYIMRVNMVHIYYYPSFW